MPHLPDVGVLALVPECFHARWMSRQQVLTRLGRYFNVLWMNPARHWRELLHRRRPALALPDLGPDSGFEVHEPEPWLPVVYRPAWLERLTDSTRLRRARARLLQRGPRRIVLHVWRPEFAAALDRVDFDLSLYHVVDEYTFSDEDLPIPDRERRLLERSDRVIVHSPGLMEKKGGLNPATHQVPNGVDFQSLAGTGPEPSDLADVPRPRIGYCGRLKNQLDWDLIEALAERHPDWSFVFTGSAAPHAGLDATLRSLGERPNVHLLGYKPTTELVRYPRHFDVCMMPYRVTAYTNCIYPLKLHEYLATERPVVGTSIRTLRDFASVVYLADGVDEWSAAIEAALVEPPERASDRVAVARRHDWDRIAYRVASIMAAGLGGDVQARFAAIAVPEDWRDPA